MVNVQHIFNHFWSSIIESLNFKMDEHIIEVKIKTNDNGNEQRHLIIFKEVIAFCWINGQRNNEQRSGILLIYPQLCIKKIR